MFFVVSVSYETKHEKSSKKSGQLGAKFGAKSGTEVRKIRGTFVLQLFRPKVFLRKTISGPNKGGHCKRGLLIGIS